MAQVTIPANAWTDLSQLTTLDVDTIYQIQNTGLTSLRINSKNDQSTQPVSVAPDNMLVDPKDFFRAQRTTATSALWIYSPGSDGLVSTAETI